MSPEKRSSIIFDQEKSWNARKVDLRMYYEAYLAGLNEVERQKGGWACSTHRIYQARLYEIERQQLSLIK